MYSMFCESFNKWMIREEGEYIYRLLRREHNGQMLRIKYFRTMAQFNAMPWKNGDKNNLGECTMAKC